MERSAAVGCRRATDRARWLRRTSRRVCSRAPCEPQLASFSTTFSIRHPCTSVPYPQLSLSLWLSRPVGKGHSLLMWPSAHQFLTPSVFVCCHFPRERPSESLSLSLFLGSWPGLWVSLDKTPTSAWMGCDKRWGQAWLFRACLPQSCSLSWDWAPSLPSRRLSARQ